MTRRQCWGCSLPAQALLVLPGAARAADDGWTSRQLLLLAVVAVSVVLVAVAYLRIARKSAPVPPSPGPAPRPAGGPIAAAPPEATAIVMTPGASAAFATASRTTPSAAAVAAPALTAGDGATDLLLEPLPWVELRASHGPWSGQVFTLPTPNGALAISIGRDAASCQLVLPNELDSVGRLHAMLIWNPQTGGLVVEDAGSDHGTFVNARRIAPHEATPLQDGDVVDLGGPASQRLSVMLPAADGGAARRLGHQCLAHGHLFRAAPGMAAEQEACPVCATMPNPTLVTRARTLPASAAATVAPGPHGAGGTAAADAASANEPAVEPAVGWLMCTQGPDRGRDFRLVAGANAIGRGDEMPVRLAGDGAVQRAQHAVVDFDATRRVFVLRPGDNRGLVYLNGVELKAATPMAAQDRIELGSSTLVFVPLAPPGQAAAMDLDL